MKKWLLTRKLVKAGFEAPHITDRVIRVFKQQTKGNHGISDLDAWKKLIRNWNCATVTWEQDNNIKRAYYNLTLTYDATNNTIHNIHNHRGCDLNRNVSEEKRNQLNKLLQIK